MTAVDLATNSFGQSFNVTMVQLITGFSSLINGGYYYEPHVVKQIQDDNGNVTENKDPVLVKKTISKETSDIIKDYMLGVVEEGTGASAAVEGYAVGGKTGTAENPRGRDHSTFLSFAPKDNPKIAISVYVENGGFGASAALPIASLLEEYYLTDTIRRPVLLDYVRNMTINYPAYDR